MQSKPSTILTPGRANAKTRKQGERYEAAILHLAPHTLADPKGKRNVCGFATDGCIAACLNVAGRGQITGPIAYANAMRYPIQRARIAKTRWFWNDRRGFIGKLESELTNLARRARRRDKQPVARLNGTSDLPWEKLGAGLIARHNDVVFYDYTKSRDRALSFARHELPANYHLTYSASERDSDADLAALLEQGVNVAIVFSGPAPTTWNGYPVVDGTAHDWTFEHPPGTVLALQPKARAKRDTSGFVRTIQPAV